MFIRMGFGNVGDMVLGIAAISVNPAKNAIDLR